MAAVAMVVPAEPPRETTPSMAPWSKSRPRIALAPTAMAATLRPRSLSVRSTERFSFAAAATSSREMSAANGGLPSTPTSIISVRRPALSIRSRRKENSSPLVSNVPINATVFVIIASTSEQLARGKHPALRHRAEKRLGARRRIDGNQFQRLPASVHRGVVDVGRNVNHISGADGFPLLRRRYRSSACLARRLRREPLRFPGDCAERGLSRVARAQHPW